MMGDDRRLLGQLLLERARLVSAAGRLKTDHAAVRAPRRVEEVIGNVREAAHEAGLSPDRVEARYRALVAAYIAWETKGFARAPTHAAHSNQPAALSDLRTQIDALDRRIVTCIAAVSQNRPEPGEDSDLAAMVEADAAERELVATVLEVLLSDRTEAEPEPRDRGPASAD